MFLSKLSRVWCVAMLLGCALPPKSAAAPPLTTIQDVLYKADGSRFNGVAVVEWKGFEAADSSVIPTQFVTFQIRNGNLRVQLVPTTNASNSAYYSVRYNSDGKVQFGEIWAVRPSSTPLRLRDVRVSRDSAALQPGQVIQGGGPGFIDNEIPAGAVDGANLSFSLANPPEPPSSLSLFRNGVLQKKGLDYELSGAAISFIAGSAPQDGDVLLASYRLIDTGNPIGEAGGALTGSYPNPTLAPSAVFDANVAPAAFIVESKLALNHPTHSNAADVRVICSSQGATTSSQTMATLGSCRIPPEALASGSRIEIRFDYSHEGAATAFNAKVLWGSSALLSRSGGPSESFITGRIEAGVLASSAHWNSQTWGSGSGAVVSGGEVSDALSSGLDVTLQAQMNGPTADSVSLRNFTVIAYPAR